MNTAVKLRRISCCATCLLVQQSRISSNEVWFKILTLGVDIQAVEMSDCLHFEVFFPPSMCKFYFILHFSPTPDSVSLTKENQFRCNVDSNMTVAPHFFVEQSLRTRDPSRCRSLHFYTARYYTATSHLVFLRAYLLRSV